MIRFLLDTNIIIHVRRARPPAVLARFRDLAPGSVGMSAVTYGELRYGIEKSGDPAASETLAALIDLIPVRPLGEAAAEHYGAIRAILARDGRMIGNNDLWIAAQARSEGLVLVTNNEREFERVPGLAIENWTR